MKITVQIAIQSEEGQTAVFQEVACLERGALRPDALGLSLTEARSILATLEQTMAERQTTDFVAQARRCPRCGRQRACKGHHAIVFRTPFGKLKLDSPQLYRCPCEPPGPQTVSPLAELLPERPSPELAYLETKFPALVSYGLTVKLLQEVLPIAEDLNTAAIQMQVHRTAQRLEAERGEAREGVRDGDALLEPSAPWVVGLDGVYVHPRISPPEPKAGLRSSWARACPPRTRPRSVSGS